MNNKKIIIALAVIAALALVLSGCGDMFEKIKNPAVGKIVSQSAFQANDAEPDSASIYERLMAKIPIGAGDTPTTGTVTNPNGGSASFSGLLTATTVEIDFVYTDWACSNPELGDYTVSGGMHCSITSQWFNAGDPDYTDDHETDGDALTTGDQHLHLYFKQTGDAIILATGSDTRTTEYDLTSDYYAGVEGDTVMITNETYGKIGGKEIETFVDSFNASL